MGLTAGVTTAGGIATPTGQGSDGGDGYRGNTGSDYQGGGGGGSSAPGQDGSAAASATGGFGGAGSSVSITGTALSYAGGGGGSGSTTGGAGGAGGGGTGSGNSYNGATINGTINTGGGGGGMLPYASGSLSGSGGSGIVILRYPTADVSSYAVTGTLDTTADTAYPIANTAYYKLNGDALDSSGNGYNGTASNLSPYAAGRFGQAAVFNGSSSHVDFTSPIPDTNTAASFSCWFNMSTLHASGYKSLIGAGNMTSGAGILSVLLRYASAGNYYIEPSRAFGSYTYYTATSNYSTVALSANTWYNVVYTYETSKQAKIYLNGVLVSTTSLTTTSGPTTNSGVLALGQYRDSNSASNWNGSIDQVRIFTSALTSANVTSLYNEGTVNESTDGTDSILQFIGGTGTVTFS